MNNPHAIFTTLSSFISQAPESSDASNAGHVSNIVGLSKESKDTAGDNSKERIAEPSRLVQEGIKRSAGVSAQQTWESHREEKRTLANEFAVLGGSVGSRHFSTSDNISTSTHSSQKRTYPEEAGHTSILFEDPPAKKPRHPVLPRRSLDQLSFTRASSQTASPPSPLFFSNTSRTRPPLPARFSSSEAGATMLSRALDNGGVKTVKMARGSIENTSSPSRAANMPGDQLSNKQTSTPRASSLEDKENSPSLQVLGQVGVTEILEQDDRPTFIIDLGNNSNFQSGVLHVVYANPALRACHGLFEMICGKSDRGSPSQSSFQDFKAWSVGFAKNIESQQRSYIYGAITWSSSTLRKRMRLIRAQLSIDDFDLVSRSAPTSFGSTQSVRRQWDKSPLINEIEQTNPAQEAPSDYFGNASLVGSEAANAQVSKQVAIPSIESPDVSSETDKLVTNITEASQLNLDDKDAIPFWDLPPNEAILRAATVAAVDWFDIPKRSSQGLFDWTRISVTPEMPEHVQFARSIDWSSTSLGPIEEWSLALRSMCNMIMASPHPAAMYWGDDHIAIYNEAYILLAGSKHPRLMGQSYQEAWAEIWDSVADVFASARTTGESTMKDDDCLFLHRSGFLEETYFSWSIIPLIGDDGSVVGLYNPAFEKTRRKIAERRMLTLREVGEQTAAAREVKIFWSKVLRGLEYNEYDTPFVLLYSVTDDMGSDASSVQSSSAAHAKSAVLEGSLGVPGGHTAAPPLIDLKRGSEGFGQIFREAMKTDRPILLQTEDGTLDPRIIEGICWRGFGDPCKAAIVCPIHPTTGDSILGFLVMGVNPRRPYDDDYNLFVQLLMRQLATSMAAVVLFEEEIRQGQRAAKLAALDRIELQEELAARTQEAVESETKFTRMAEFAPVGMFIANSEGRITYCNDTWYDISRVPKEEHSTDDWMACVEEEDLARIERLWANLVIDTIPMNAEFRFKTPWQDPNGAQGETWVLASAYPEKNQDGSLKSVFGSITDISQQKWAEDFQKRRRHEAVELKRQQENFMDITSHEMRNPLSSILLCADEISTSLADYKADYAAQKLSIELIDSTIDAAQTIALCAQHQKRIVDDVLTLSKLDSALLLVTPVDVQPVTVVRRALKMFEGEISTADIKMEFKVDISLKKLKVDWVKLDPSRLLQVLINLTTNAIKFTTTQAKRNLTVSIAATMGGPSDAERSSMSYFPTRSQRADLIEGADWGTGEKVFLHFAVQDSGRGLNDAEMKLLFHRFSQASPRTHVQYGGSGLGLFISRELVELQGGEIGVKSESGKGSTFAFYIKARRSTAPSAKDAIDQMPPSVVVGARRASAKANSEASENGQSLQSTSKVTSPTKQGSVMRATPLRVLIVEDNLVNQRVLLKQLRNLGCVVYVANHGGEAIDLLKDSQFWANHTNQSLEIDVILMDQEMPVMDGLTCTRKIRELQREGNVVSHVPIIAVTANARSEQIETARDAGMDDVVSKPFRIPELISKIEELVARYRPSTPKLS